MISPNVETIFTEYNTVDITLRLFAALVCGFIIGFEREYTSKLAGLRTHILVVMGACVFTILSIYAFPKFMVNGAQMAVGDSARVAAQIITGIGFIGGGTVLRHGASVFGLTTAASLWLSASVGMALGTGDYYIALVATIFCVFVLVFVRKFQDVVIKPNRKKFATIKVLLIVDEADTSSVIGQLYDKFDNILDMTVKKTLRDEENKAKISFKADVSSKNPTKTAFQVVYNIDKVDSISIQQDFSE